jgi:hypothetical protein
MAMSDTGPAIGTTWRRAFEAHPSRARAVRSWIIDRVTHPDAPLVGHELFVIVLQGRSPAVEMTLSTAGGRIRITALGDTSLRLHHTHGPGATLASAFARQYGVDADARGVWAHLAAEEGAER